jgi:acid phosphatase type 7
MRTIEGRVRAAVLATTVLAFAVGAPAQNQNSNNNRWSNSKGWSIGNWVPNDNPWPYSNLQGPPVLAVVGDVACQPGEDELPGEKAGENCVGDLAQNLLASQAATAQQIENMKPDAVALVGDEQYQVGQYSDFEGSYETTYGAFKMITRPAPGNHEFYTEHGATGVAGYGYFSYFNGVQYNTDGTMMTATISGNPDTGGTFTQPVPFSDGQAGHFEQTGGLGTNSTGGPVGVGDGWYSYNLGSWHLISLNIECETQPGGCSNTGSWFAAELKWLQNDLATNHSACTVAYWHQPTYSPNNGLSLEGTTAQAFWQLLYQYGADLVLNGHDHLYARYRPLDPNENYDPVKGIREFVVGTGGETLDAVELTGTTSDPLGNPNFNTLNLESATGEFWGVMGLTLYPNGYAWDYESALKDPAQTTGPATFSDTGFAACHGAPGWGNNQNAKNKGGKGIGN